MKTEVFDHTICQLGEGPLWHPERKQLFWCDIPGQRLLTNAGGETNIWEFDEVVTCPTWVDTDMLLLATETSFQLFNIKTGESEFVAPLESELPGNRSNDGRADPFGGFWIGTMGNAAEHKAGAIYRYYRGEVRLLFPKVTIPNAICFSPDGLYAYFTDTKIGDIMRQPLELTSGWPKGAPEIFIAAGTTVGSPDGAIVDASGNLWNARWGGWGIDCFASNGDFLHKVEINAANTTCPAAGGHDLKTLFCTSANQGLNDAETPENPDHGKTFFGEGMITGQAEHKVIL